MVFFFQICMCLDIGLLRKFVSQNKKVVGCVVTKFGIKKNKGRYVYIFGNSLDSQCCMQIHTPNGS